MKFCIVIWNAKSRIEFVRIKILQFLFIGDIYKKTLLKHQFRNIYLSSVIVKAYLNALAIGLLYVSYKCHSFFVIGSRHSYSDPAVLLND